MFERRFGSSVMSGGILLVATCFLLFAASANRSGQGDSTRAASMFSSSNGLLVGSKVVIAGVVVGEVTSVTLDRKSDLSLVAFTRPRKLVIPADSSVSVEGSGAMGAAALSINPGRSTEPLKPDAVITRSVPASSLEDEIGDFIFGDGGLDDSE